MDDETSVKAKKLINTTLYRITPVRKAVSVLAVYMLFWTVWSAFGAEIELSGNNNWGFRIGVVTILVGVIFVIIGLPLLINLLLKLYQQFQKQDDDYIDPGYLVYSGGTGAGEMKSVHTIIGRILVTSITMIMLGWASYTGYRLATEPRRKDMYYPLVFPIGVVTIVFGSVYIVLGLALIADLALDLVVHFLQGKQKRIEVHQDPNTEAKDFV